MPRIVPLQLLKCLKVLLDDNGGILSISEVKRIAGLMTKYSKKLVSKCIYVQILKVTKTELLGEFMGVGGWSLVYNWLNDAIRAMNWPLVQEILELLLLCPVDVDRLKINSAPKLVKGLCKDGGNEGVRILAKRLVEQWLKVVTENTAATQVDSISSSQPAPIVVTQQAAATERPLFAPMIASTPENKFATAEATTMTKSAKAPTATVAATAQSMEVDPLADVADVPPSPSTYSLTPAQKKASEAGLVYKIICKNGQQVLAKVPKIKPETAHIEDEGDREMENGDDVENVDADADADADIDDRDDVETMEQDEETTASNLVDEEEDDTRTSLDKADKESESSADEESRTAKPAPEGQTVVDAKSAETEKEKQERRERRSSKDSKDGKGREKEHHKSDKEKKSSSSHKSSSSSSSHKSKSASSSSSSTTSSKSKSSSSSSRRSSSDKHRSDKDKDRSSSSKDKDRKEGSSSSSSSKHRSSSSSKSSSSSSSKDRHRDKEKDKSSSTSSSTSTTVSSKKDKDREKDAVNLEKDKDTPTKPQLPSIDKLPKIPKKPRDEFEAELAKATSITIPSKKASMSIEIRRDSDKAKTVKTYKSQFRSHGLTEEAPPPPSRKGLKKPSSGISAPGTIIPLSLPSALKRPSPPPSDSPTQKKNKIDINNVIVANEKPGAIKLIAPKKIQTLIETNIFSDALSAATGPKKLTKRKRPTTPASGQSKEGPSPPTSPDGPKVAPLKFYQDTLDESKSEEKSDKENDAKEQNKSLDDANAEKENSTEDDDDIPLKKVKEDIEQKVLREQKAASESSGNTSASGSVEINSDTEEGSAAAAATPATKDTNEGEELLERKPGPGCGPNGPPGVLMLHRRKGPKKKLTWRPQEHLEQIRYFELDETERVNVTKTTSFLDMKNLERYNERDAINIARRGFTHEDNMKPQTAWNELIEVDDVPQHPNGSQSKQRKVQAEREQTTLRALYFSHAMIPDSPSEAELEPHYAHDIPVIPLDDITGNPDAVNDFTSMPWPEPKGSPKYGDNSLSGTGGFSTLATDLLCVPGQSVVNGAGFNSYNPFVKAPAGGLPGPHQQQMQLQMAQAQAQAQAQNTHAPPGWSPMMGNAPFNNHMGGSPSVELCPVPMGHGVQQQNFMGQFGPGSGPPPPFIGAAPPYAAPAGYANFGAMGHNGGPMANAMNAVVASAAFNAQMMNGPPGSRHNNSHNRNSGGGGGNWRTGSNFQEGSGGSGGSGSNWRSTAGGPNRGGNNNGVCKAFMRGHCRLGKSCKFIHPKSKRI